MWIRIFYYQTNKQTNKNKNKNNLNFEVLNISNIRGSIYGRLIRLSCCCFLFCFYKLAHFILFFLHAELRTFNTLELCGILSLVLFYRARVCYFCVASYPLFCFTEHGFVTFVWYHIPFSVLQSTGLLLLRDVC